MHCTVQLYCKGLYHDDIIRALNFPEQKKKKKGRGEGRYVSYIYKGILILTLDSDNKNRTERCTNAVYALSCC